MGVLIDITGTLVIFVAQQNFAVMTFSRTLLMALLLTTGYAQLLVALQTT